MRSGLLFVFLHALRVVTAETCIPAKDFTRTVMKKERKLEPESVNEERVYIMCVNEIINVKKYDWYSSEFTGEGSEALSIWNSNVEIKCGKDGDIDNNCVFDGGTYHIEIISADELNEGELLPLRNIKITGFTFKGAKESSIIVYGADIVGKKKIGAEVTITNCEFTGNKGYSVVESFYNDRTHINIVRSRFHNNKLSSDPDIHVALILVELGATIRLTGTNFTKNTIKKEWDNDGYASVIKLGTKTYKNVLTVNNCIFFKNSGMTNAIATADFNDNASYWIKNSFVDRNTYKNDNYCNGIKGTVTDLFSKRTCLVIFDTFTSPTISPSPTLSPTKSNKPSVTQATDNPTVEFDGCWSNMFTQRVEKYESKVTDTTKKRVYRMCKGTTTNIAPYNWAKKTFMVKDGGIRALRLWNPNVEIRCGWNDADDCIFTGGDFHIEILDAKHVSRQFTRNGLENITIQGFTFTGTKTSNIYISGTPEMLTNKATSVTIKNCVFKDNDVTSVVTIDENYGSHLTIRDSVFRNNTLQYDQDFPNAGLITAAEVGVNLSINNTVFRKNNVRGGGVKNYTSLIYAGGRPFPEIVSSIQIENSDFISNEGMSRSLVTGGFLYDSDISSTNNFFFNNKFRSGDVEICDGISRIRKSWDIAFEECVLPFAGNLTNPPSPSLAPVATPTTCWEGSTFTTRVMEAEDLVTDTSIQRIYVMCKKSVAKIMTYNFTTETFIKEKSKTETLSIWNSNVIIKCETDDKSCVFRGGSSQIEVVPAPYRNESYSYLPIRNVEIQGFKFKDATVSNIIIYGLDVEYRGSPAPGASVAVNDCIFTDNNANAMIRIDYNYNTYLTVDRCKFVDNKLIDDEEYIHTGIITSYYAGKITITNTEFERNELAKQGLQEGLRAVVLAIEEEPQYSANQHGAMVSVTDSTFIENTGNTFALVIVGLWSDGNFFQASNSYKSNSYTDAYGQSCNGMARITQNYYYYAYYTDPFTWDQIFFDDYSDCVAIFDENEGSDPTCGTTEPSRAKKDDGSGKMVDCKQDNKQDQEKKCQNNWFNKVCVVSCCNSGEDDGPDPTCGTTEPSKVNKDGSDKMVDCKQDNKKDQKKKCKKNWFNKVCVVSCCKNDGDSGGDDDATFECGEYSEPSKVKKDGSDKMVDCKQDKKKDQEKKCQNFDWFKDVCLKSCCSVGFLPVDPKCKLLTEPSKFLKPDGSGKELDCKQSNQKDQKEKCQKDWFKSECPKSCCSTATVTNPVTNSPVSVPDSNSKCKGLSEPKNFKRPKDNKKIACIQENEADQKDKCEKDWFRDICVVSCCGVQ